MFLLFIKNLTTDFGWWVGVKLFFFPGSPGKKVGLKYVVLFDASFYAIQQCFIHIYLLLLCVNY